MSVCKKIAAKINDELKWNFKGSKKEIKEDVGKLRDESRGDIAELRKEFMADNI